MPKTVERTVTVLDSKDGAYKTFLPGDEMDDELAKSVSNPAVFTAEETEDQRRQRETVALLTNQVQVEGGGFRTATQYAVLSVPVLKEIAEERNIDLTGAGRKQEIVDKLVADDERIQREYGGVPPEQVPEEDLS